MTIDQFIVELQRVSESKRKLPLVIECPNGLMVEPKIKMDINNPFSKQQKVLKMVISWR